MTIHKAKVKQENRKSTQIWGSNNKSPVLKTEVTNSVTGITIIVEIVKDIDVTAAESNLHRQYQIIGTASSLPPLVKQLELVPTMKSTITVS